MVEMMDAADLLLLVVGGLAAGVINTLAGGGSLITVALLVALGLPGTLANGTNRLGVLVQNVTAAWRFRAEGLSGFGKAVPVLIPVLAGSLLGAFLISRVSPEFFERLFGVVMVGMLVPLLRPARSAKPVAAPGEAGQRELALGWSLPVRTAVFFAIGLYGGAIQAGVGIFLLFALSRAGYGLVLGNSVKVVVTAAVTAIALPVFIARDQVVWPAAIALAIGFALGGTLGVRLAVLGGERVIKPVLALAVVGLAAQMLGFF